jgi:nucleoside-diphosphate-sugar epimerase
MEKKILILASTSFIGKNIKKYLEKNHTIFCIDRKDVDFKNEELLKSAIKQIDPEIVINCCGIVGSSVKNKNIHDYDILNENIILNANILNSCKNLNIKKIIVFSSYRLFGDDIHSSYDENDVQKSDINYNIGYLTSKKVLDSQVKLFMKEYNIDVVCLIMTNIFGCYDDFSVNGRIVPSMIANIKEHIINQSDMVIPSNKNTLVNLVFVDDISKLVELCILKENIRGNIIIFNKDGIITLDNLTNKIANLFNFKNKILFKNDHILTESNIMNPNLQVFNNFFTDFKFTELEKGLKVTTDFFNLLESE